MVVDRPCWWRTEERGGRFGRELLSEPKLGRVTIVLPPLTETPGTAGVPLGLLPVPPGPMAGEMPPRALRSVPCSGSSGSAAFTGHAATRALTVTDACPSTGAAHAGVVPAGRREG